MTTAASNAPTDVDSAAGDDLDAYVAERSERDDDFRHAHDDIDDLNRVIDQLVAMRKAAGVSQSRVARAMGVRQPTVSQFENESSDPRLSTLQRYARALGVRLHLGLETADEASWTPRCVQFQNVETQAAPRVYISHSNARPGLEVVLGTDAWDKRLAADNSRAGYALGA